MIVTGRQTDQGWSIGLKRLGLETVLSRFIERLGFRLDTITSSSRYRRSLKTQTSRYRLGLGIICLIYIELQSSDLSLSQICKVVFDQ